MARILVVDDDADMCSLVKFILENRGYEVEIVSSGEECLFRLSRGSCPDLILMDFIMPGRDGLRITGDIKSNPETKHIPVYLFTVVANEEWRRGFEESGADGYISKPFSVREFLSIIDNILER